MPPHSPRTDTPRTPVRALLFDLGGVLIDVDFQRAFKVWAPFSRLSAQQMAQRFGPDLAYQRHERGEIDAITYFDHLAKVLQLEADHGQIEAGWNAIFGGEITATLRCVRAARTRWPCHVFSNTNATHQRAWTALYPDTMASVDRWFVSSEMGLRKPDVAAFHHVADALGLPPAALLFFDDLSQNVQGAQAAGLRAVHVRSPLDVRQALQGLGVRNLALPD